MQHTNLDIELQQFNVHADNLVIMQAYLDYDIRDKKIDDGWSHRCILQDLAHLQKLELNIWQLDDNGEIKPHQYYSYYQANQASQTIDLLFVNSNHFERLTREAMRQNSYLASSKAVASIEQQLAEDSIKLHI